VNMTEKGPATKAAIIGAATELFSAYGFAGASVRQIAANSSVNIAAINYHFGNKHNLYWAVMVETHRSLDEGLREISATATSVQDLTLKAFDFSMTRKAEVRTAVKLMMSEGVPEPEGEYAEITCRQAGPPGFHHFARVLDRQLEVKVSQEVLGWGVMAIFSGLFHWSMICSSEEFSQEKNRMPGFSDVEIRRHLHFQADAAVKYIETHHREIQEKLAIQG
jgi:AcrR family transcriptional regulator